MYYMQGHWIIPGLGDFQSFEEAVNAALFAGILTMDHRKMLIGCEEEVRLHGISLIPPLEAA